MCLLVKLYLRLHGVNYGRGLRVWSFPFCRKHPSARITIGDNVTILNTISENAAGIAHRTVLVAGPGANIHIGNNVGMSGVILYSTLEIVIEDWVLLGAGARIYDTDFHPCAASDRRTNNQAAIRRKAVRVCEDVFIGANATLLKGVTVGSRAIIGAGAVVTSDIAPDTLAVGIPARSVVR